MSYSEAIAFGCRGDIGEKLKSTAQDSPSWNGTNESGFSAAPGGARYTGAFWANWYWNFYETIGEASYYWVPDDDGLMIRTLISDSLGVYRKNFTPNGQGLSVRCVKDSE